MSAIDLLLTTGNGPAECRIALSALIGILGDRARAAGVAIEIEPGPSPDRHGPKSALASLQGPGAEALARAFAGTVKFIFKSPVRPGHKRQNWFVSVKRLDAPPPGAEPIRAADLSFETLRAGGPGGQHQNTTDSAVRAIHRPTGLSVVARSERSQHRNRAIAIKRLEAMLHHLATEQAEAHRADRFLANRQVERGNAVAIFRL